MNRLDGYDWLRLRLWCRENAPHLEANARFALGNYHFRDQRKFRRAYRSRAAPVIVAFQAWALVTP